MKDNDKELTSRYYIAEACIWLLGSVLVVAQFIGLAPDQALPILNITPEATQHFPKVVAILQLAAILYLAFEWKQSTRSSRSSPGQGVRLFVTILWATASLWISYPIVSRNTQYVGISPAWYLGFVTIGFMLGFFSSVVASSAFMIRTSEESKQLGALRGFVWVGVIAFRACT